MDDRFYSVNEVKDILRNYEAVVSVGANLESHSTSILEAVIETAGNIPE